MGLRKSRKWLIPILKNIFFGVRKIEYKDIPIVVNNYNRLSMMRILIEGLEGRAYHNIHIIGNGSSCGPLQDYLQPLAVVFDNKRMTDEELYYLNHIKTTTYWSE